jgi:hypothetical protein
MVPIGVLLFVFHYAQGGVPVSIFNSPASQAKTEKSAQGFQSTAQMRSSFIRD